MYIGNPYHLVISVRDPSPGADHSPPWSPKMFQSLEGTYTMWSPVYRSQARKLTWPWLTPAEAKDISMAIRSIDSPGPIACWDPLSPNLMGPAQAMGLGATWLFGSDSVNPVFTNPPNTNPNSTINRRVQVGNVTSTGTKIYWKNPSWPGFPISKFSAADKSFYFQWANGGFSLGTGGTIGVDALDAAGSVIETISAAATSNNGVVSGSFVTSSLVFARPFVKFGPAVTFTGPGDMGITALRIGTTTPTPSIFDEGVGSPGYGVQSFSDVINWWPSNTGPYRTITASLVEVIQSPDS